METIAADGTRIHVETTGEGAPLLFIHEFAGDHRSWEPQVRHFGRHYRCITYAARGYEPSDVPTDAARYSQTHAVNDALAVLDSVGVERAHVVGLSMGGFVAAHLARLHPDRVRSAVVAGAGYGAPYDTRVSFQRECEEIAKAFESEGAAAVAPRYAVGPARVQFEAKDPRGHAEFAAALAEHSSIGAALTMRGFQRGRPSLYDFEREWRQVQVPLLLVSGDEDEGCLEPSLQLKRWIPSAALTVLPRTGHTVNLEEPQRFNRLVADFLAQVDAGAWRTRDPRSLSSSTTGMDAEAAE